MKDWDLILVQAFSTIQTFNHKTFFFSPSYQPFQTHCRLKVVLFFGAQVKALAKEHYLLRNWKESSHSPNHVFLSTLLFACDGCANSTVFYKSQLLNTTTLNFESIAFTFLHSPFKSPLFIYAQSSCLQNKMQMTSSSFMNAHWPPF